MPSHLELTIELERVKEDIRRVEEAVAKLSSRKGLRPRISHTLSLARRADAKLWRLKTRASFDAMDKAGAFADSRRPDPNYWNSE